MSPDLNATEQDWKQVMSLNQLISDFQNTGEVLRYYKTCYAEKLANGEYVGGIHWVLLRTYLDMEEVKSEDRCFNSEKELLEAYPAAKRMPPDCACYHAYLDAGFTHSKCPNRNKFPTWKR